MRALRLILNTTLLVLLVCGHVSAQDLKADPGSETALDHRAGLMWVANSNYASSVGFGDGFLTWGEALRFVAAMNAGQIENFGYDDWRLPSPREIRFVAESTVRSKRGSVGSPELTIRYWTDRSLGSETTQVAFDEDAQGFRRVNSPSDSSLAWPVRSLAAPADFRRVALFAANSIQLKDRAEVESGDIVVNDSATGKTLSPKHELEIGHGASTPSEFIVAADRIRIKGNGTVIGGDIFFNELRAQNNPTFLGQQNTPLDLPVFAMLPAFESGTPGVQDVTVPHRSSATLLPGDFGRVEVQDGATLFLTGGIYNLRSLEVRNGASLLFEGPSEVRVEGKLKAGDRSTVGPAAGSGLEASDIVFFVAQSNSNPTGQPKAVEIGHDADSAANYFAPNGTIELRDRAEAIGAFLALNLKVGHDVRISLDSAFGNTPPIAVDDSVTVDESGTANILDSGAASLLDNDIDSDGDPLTVTLPQLNGPSNGTLSLNADGTFSYTHDGSETASDSFVYEACDPTGACDTATVSITINPVNDAPQAADDSFTVDEGGTASVLDSGQASLLANDSDPEDDSLVLTVVPVSGPANGALTLNADGTFSYIHDGSETTSDSFVYEVCDDGSPVACDTATVTVTVNPVNDPPVAQDDALTVLEGGSASILNSGATSLLANDSDPENDSLVVTAAPVAGPSNGTVLLSPDGTFIYTHNGSETLTDLFVYQVCDDGTPQQCATAAVGVSVILVDDPAVAVDDSFSVIGNTELIVGVPSPATPHTISGPGVLANDFDPDGSGSLEVQAGVFATTQAGAISINADGSFFYRPPVGFEGVDTFEYTLVGGAVATIEFNIAESVWYIDNTNAGVDTFGGDGRSHDPLRRLKSVESRPGFGAGDTIFVFRGDESPNFQDEGIVLLPGQQLLGQGQALTVVGVTLVASDGGPAPVITNFSGPGVLLASANRVDNLEIIARGGPGVLGTSVDSGLFEDLTISDSSGGIHITQAVGSFDINRLTVAGSVSQGVRLTSSPNAVFSFDDLVISSQGAEGLLAQDAGTLTVTGSGNRILTLVSGAILMTGTSIGGQGMTFLSVDAAGGGNTVDTGISIRNAGNLAGSFFRVTGDGTAGSGGTIEGTVRRGAEFIGVREVGLESVRFINASSLNGDDPSDVDGECSLLDSAGNLGCHAALHLVNISSAASLRELEISGSEQHGINGNNVANLSLINSRISEAGNETQESGINLLNLSGTAVFTDNVVTNNSFNGLHLGQGTGSVDIAITGGTFGEQALSHGVNIETFGVSSQVDVRIQGVVFAGNLGSGIDVFSHGSSRANVLIGGASASEANSFSNLTNAVNLQSRDAALLTFEVRNNTTLARTVSSASAISAVVSAPSAAGLRLSGTVADNRIGDENISGSGSANAFGILARVSGDGSANFLFDGNTIRSVDQDSGIFLSARDGAGRLNATLRNNDVNLASPNAFFPVDVNSGASTRGDSSVVCLSIEGSNQLASASGDEDVGLRALSDAPAAARILLPGYAGGQTDTSAVEAFLTSTPGVDSAFARVIGTSAGYAGTASCPLP